MLRILKNTLLIFLCFSASNSFASTEQEQIYLVQLMDQLDATIPTILAAQKEQPSNLRVQFHYVSWRDSKGQFHNGLLEDIKNIQAGIREKLNNTTPEPRVLTVTVGDYLNQDQPNVVKAHGNE